MKEVPTPSNQMENLKKFMVNKVKGIIDKEGGHSHSHSKKNTIKARIRERRRQSIFSNIPIEELEELEAPVEGCEKCLKFFNTVYNRIRGRVMRVLETITFNLLILIFAVFSLFNEDFMLLTLPPS